MRSTSVADAIGTAAEDDLRKLVEAADAGSAEELVQRLEAEMLDAARKLEFERAASLRDRIDDVRAAEASGGGGAGGGAAMAAAARRARGAGEPRRDRAALRPGSLMSLESFALPIIKYALSEDIGTGDITTLNAVPSGVNARAAIVVKAPGVLAGLDVARLTFREAAPALKFRPLASDGDAIEPGAAVAQVVGDIGGILKAERTALNFLQHLSGVATLTRRFVDEIAGTGAIILDTRKTTPGLRFLEKFAVTSGGGQNHRLALWDMYLVKDNHIRAAGGITRGGRSHRAHAPGRPAARGRGGVARPADRRAAARGGPHPGGQPHARRGEAGAVEAVDRWCAPHPSDSPRTPRGRAALARGRSVGRHHAHHRARVRRRPAPTTCRSARSRTPRRPST